MAPLGDHLVPAQVQAVLDELNTSTSQAINKLWLRYQAGDYPAASANASESRLEIVKACDLLVNRPRDGLTDEIYDLQVMNFEAKDRVGNNFMGYAAYHNCIAFRGETRHMQTFLDFAYAMLRDSSAEPVFKRGSEVKFPDEGLVNGLSYDEFSARVEIVELALYLNEDQDAEEIDTGETTIMLLSVSKDGQQLVAPPSDDAQYDVDVSLESAESARVPEDDIINPAEDRPAPNCEHDSGPPTEKATRNPILAAADVPRIEIHPPSTGRPGTEYLRPTSWSPLTNPEEDGVAPEAEVTDIVAAYDNTAGVEAPVNTEDDAHLSAPTGINDLESASELMEQIVTLRQREGHPDPVEAEDDDDQLMTDGSLFGGTPGHDNESESNHSTRDLENPSHGTLEKPLSNVGNAVHEQPVERGGLGHDETGFETIPAPTDGPVGDSAVSVTTAEPVFTEPNATHSTNASTITELPDSQEDILGVDVPMPHGQSDEKDQQAVEALQTANAPDTTLAVENAIDTPHVATESDTVFQPAPEEPIACNETHSDLAQASETSAQQLSGGPKALHSNDTECSETQRFEIQVDDHCRQISDVGDDQQVGSAPNTSTIEYHKPVAERSEGSQYLAQDQQPSSSQHDAASVAVPDVTAILDKPKHKSAPTDRRDAEHEGPMLLASELHVLQSEGKDAQIGLFHEQNNDSGGQSADLEREVIHSSLTPDSAGQADEQVSGLDVLATAAASETGMNARKVLASADDRRHAATASISTTIDPVPFDAPRQAHGPSQTDHMIASGADQAQNNQEAGFQEGSGHGSGSVVHEPIGYALQRITTTPRKHTPPKTYHDQVPESPIPSITGGFETVQHQVATNSQPKMISPLAPSEDGTDPLALSDDENATSTQQHHQVSYEADAALAARLAAEARRYPTRKRSSTMEGGTPPTAKKQAVQAPSRKKLPQSRPGGLGFPAPQTPQAKATPSTAQTERIPKTKKVKTFRKGTRKMPRRSDAAVNYK